MKLFHLFLIPMILLATVSNASAQATREKCDELKDIIFRESLILHLLEGEVKRGSEQITQKDVDKQKGDLEYLQELYVKYCIKVSNS